MGSMQAAEMAELASLELGIAWHLRHNHYPPVPECMDEICIEAIMAARAEDFDSEIALPDGVTYRGRCAAPVWAIIEQHHLHDWVDGDYQAKAWIEKGQT